MKVLTKTQCLRPTLNSITHVVGLPIHFLIHMRCKANTDYENILELKTEHPNKNITFIDCTFSKVHGVCVFFFGMWVFVSVDVYVCVSV